MKYLFYVQSHIAFYMALQVQEYLKINPLDVKYITVRNYNNIYHQIEPLDLSYYYDKLNSAMNLKEAINALNDIDHKIGILTNHDDYEFITHTISPPVWQFIATNPKCKKIHIIEDGSGSYHKKKELYFQPKTSLKNQFIDTIKKWISRNYSKYRKRAPGFPVFGTEPLFKDTIYYGIYEDVFPYISKERKVIFGSLYKDPNFLPNQDFENSIFLIFDATLVEQRRLMNENEYMNFILPFFKEISLNNTQIYFKFHPGQNKDITQKLKQILENDYKAVELNKDIPVEQIIIHYKNLQFYGFFSTLLFYAKRQGHFAKSFLENTQNEKIKKFILEYFNDYFIKEIFKLS